VPEDLEARLLAAIPARVSMPRRRWVGWAGVVGALAAACLLAVLLWRGRDPKGPPPSPAKGESVRRGTPSLDEDAGLAAWLEARQYPEEEEPAPFAWPLEGTSPVAVSTSIPPDLID
jgi:hypothetical protein